MADITSKLAPMRAFEPGVILRYGVAPAVVAMAFVARALLAPVLISAAVGGLGPGLLATALSLLAAAFIVAQAGAAGFGLVNSIAFAIIGIGVSWGGELLR